MASILITKDGKVLGSTDKVYSIPSQVPINKVYGLTTTSGSYLIELTQDLLPGQTIDDYSFYNNKNIEKVDLNGKTSIGKHSFYSCSNLKEILNLNAGIINTYAFYNCTNARVPNLTVQTLIDSYAFYNAGINLADTFELVTKNKCIVKDYALQYTKVSKVSGKYDYISSYAFANCSKLLELNIEECGNINSSVFRDCSTLSNIIIKANGSLGDYAFYNDYMIGNIDVKNCIFTSLGSYAFSRIGKDRSPLTNYLNIDLRNSTFNTVNSYAFGSDSSSYRNSYLNIMLPNTVKTISSYAFGYTDNCNIYFSNEVPPTLSSSNCWQNATNYKIFVPYNSVNAYRTKPENWSAQKDYIKGYAMVNDFEVGATLPSITLEGYGATWYSDDRLTNQITEVPNDTEIIYCVVGTEKLAYKLIGMTAVDCNLSVTDGVNTYNKGDIILKDTVLTITGTATTTGYIPYIFTVNNSEFESGNTYTMTQDLSIVAVYWDGTNVPIRPNFADNSWSMIKEAVKNGLAKKFWNVGDTKQVTLTDGYTYNIRIADMTEGRYELTNGTGTTNIVFEFVELLPTDYSINRSYKEGYYAGGGWALSDMKNTTMSSIYDLLPTDLQIIISEVNISTYSYTSPSPRQSANKLFLASEYEMYGTRHYSDSIEESPQFEYYKLNNTNAKRIKYKVDSPTSAVWYWLRSPDSYHSSGGYWCRVHSNGNIDYGSASTGCGCAPCFAI